ncbi:MAG: ATP synthase F1 subunit delta [Chloroflexi bacterium]|nr:ATP synthase F1 subunit delta [Chloroflexota bacterium]
MALGGSAPRRYGEAMLDLAAEEKAVDEYRGALADLAGIDPLALRSLADPSIARERRLAAAQAMVLGRPPALRGLVALLIRRERIELLPAISAAFGDLVDEREGVAKARVTTAVALDAKQRTGVVERLEKATGKRIKATFTVDPELMGGARVQVGDHLVDASLRAQLGAMRTQLARS